MNMEGDYYIMKNKNFINMLPLETERLIIRPTSLLDVDLVLKMDKQEVTQKYLGGIKQKSKEERIAFLEKKLMKYQKGLSGQLTVCWKDGTPIGLVGLNIDEEKNTGEIGYIFDYDYCNKGYCTEASRKLIEVGLKDLKLSYIFADTVDGNISSQKVLEKLGFKYTDSTNKDSVKFLNYYLYNKDETRKN